MNGPMNDMRDTRQRGLALLVAGTFFMENLDGTILTTAAPSIGTAFGVPSVAVGVTITAYLLTLAVLIPLSGWITRRFGTRRVFLAAIAIFTVASVLCALSMSLVELTVMRVLQGAGGALMVPVGRLAVLRVTERSQLIRTIAWLTWPALVAPVIAPLAGGLLTTYASWHWIFLINVPLGVIAFVVAWRIVPTSLPETPPRLDVLGFALTGAGLGLLVYVGSLLSDRGDAAVAVVLATVAVALLALAVRHFLRREHPLLTLDSLRVETFRLSHAGGSVFRLTISALPFLLPLLFQDAFGWSPVLAGSLVLWVFVGNIAIKPATTPLLRRFGFRPVLIGATTAAGISMVLAAFITAATPLWLIATLLTFSGVARSIGFTAYNTIAFADIDADAMTDANTLASTLQQLAAGFGVTVAAIALSGGIALAGGSGGGPTVPVGAFQFGFAVLAALMVLAVVEAVRLTPTAGENIRPARTA